MLFHLSICSFVFQPLHTNSDTILLSPNVIDNFSKDTVETRLSLHHHVDVFQWDREGFILSLVLLETRFFIRRDDETMRIQSGSPTSVYEWIHTKITTARRQ